LVRRFHADIRRKCRSARSSNRRSQDFDRRCRISVVHVRSRGTKT
jgi:hypothetical protein